MATVAKAKEYSFGVWRMFDFHMLSVSFKVCICFLFQSLQCFVFNNSNSLFCCFSTKKYVVCVCVNNVKLATTCNTWKVFQEVLNENKQKVSFNGKKKLQYLFIYYFVLLFRYNQLYQGFCCVVQYHLDVQFCLTSLFFILYSYIPKQIQSNFHASQYAIVFLIWNFWNQL